MIVPLDKQPSAAGNVTVIFRVPAEVGASTAEVLGEFTDWRPAVMHAEDDGGFELALDLRGGAAYRFRYLIDGERWENDWAADAYVANDYGGDDSVVDVSTAPDVAVEEPEPLAAPAKATKAAKPAKKATAKAAKTAKPAKPAKKAATARAPRKKSGPSASE